MCHWLVLCSVLVVLEKAYKRCKWKITTCIFPPEISELTTLSANADCTLSHSLLLSRDERNWATALSGWRRADYRPLQLRLRNHISPRRPPVEGMQPCVTDVDNAVVQFTECTPLRNYDRQNSECQKTEFEFINQTSNFRTLFNNPS